MMMERIILKNAHNTPRTAELWTFRLQDHSLPGTFVPTNEYNKERKFQQMCRPTCTELSLLHIMNDNNWDKSIECN